MKKTLFTLLLLLITIAIKPQVTEEWVARYTGPGFTLDNAFDIAVDIEGNVYVAGVAALDYATIKYNSAGVEQWVKTYDGPLTNSLDIATSIAVDDLGNVYVTGYSGSSQFTNNFDYATIKYNFAGVQQWVKTYDGPLSNSNDRPTSIAVDDSGNVYVTGNIKGSDLTNDYDYATIKYNSAGDQQWVQIYDGPGSGSSRSDKANSIAVDNLGNVYVSGTSLGNGTLWDYTTIKYNSNGNIMWIQRYDGPLNDDDEQFSLAIDSNGNVYVTGSSFGSATTQRDYATIKYNSSGVLQWVERYDGLGSWDDVAIAIAVDDLGYVYVTGRSESDPQINNIDFATIKYDSSGAVKWIRNYDSSRVDAPSSLAVDNIGNVYVTGSIRRGSGQFVNYDYATIKYDQTGVEQGVQTYNGPGNQDDNARSIVVNNLGSVYVTGQSYGGDITFFDFATIKYSQFAITKPLLNSKFMAGDKDTIKWNGGKAGQILQIEYSEDNGSTYNLIDIATPADSNYFIWDLPDNILTRKAKIKLTDIADPTITAVSDSFRIKPYLLTRLNPDSTYYEFRKNRDQWGFSNTPADMWPPTWYSQFDYSGIDPFAGSQYSQWQGENVFENASPPEHMDWVSWVNTFSVNACYFSTTFGIYESAALLSWRAWKSGWNGSCFGIAVANALAFSHRQQFQTKYLNFPAFINPITVVSDTGVKRVVNELYTHQAGNPHLAIRESIGLLKTPTQTLKELLEMFKEDNATIRTLSFLNNGAGGGGHAILAYGIEKDLVNPNVFHIKVYDNSNPNSNNRIRIDTSANFNNGNWSTPDWAGWGGLKWIYLRNPTIDYLTNPTLAKGMSQQSPFILEDDDLEIFSTISSSIQIRDNFGNQTGFINNLIQLDIPSSTPLVVDNGSVTPPYGYTLQTDNYSVVLNDFAEDTVETFFFTGNKSFVYERSGATQTQTDRLFFDGGVSAANPDAQTKTIKLLNLINENTQEKLTVVRSIELAQNDSVKIENPDSNKVKLISYGTSKNYDIELNYVTENGIGRFGDFNIPLDANTSHTFVPVWANITSTELKVLVDIGNDGTIDDTLSLINQVTGIGEDQGSLLTPDSYNLAQNYPNPFNPTTKIKWQSPIGSHQTLKIYDILGNEVVTLVDEFREAGRYEITVDASNLASGIYFYRLQAGSFVETKKMILLK